MMTPRKRRLNRIYNTLCIIFAAIFIITMLQVISIMPDIGDPASPTNNEVAEKYLTDASWETGSLNAVSGMILDYRAFDTLGESCVLFVATITVFLLLRRGDGEGPRPTKYLERRFDPKEDIILEKSFEFLIPVILLFGGYVIVNGHLSPGGGFSGGAVIGASFILFANAYGLADTERFINSKTYLTASVAALLFYACAKSYVFFVGANHLHSVIPVFADGTIFASGLILPLNIAVGVVVSNTVYALYLNFRRGGFRK